MLPVVLAYVAALFSPHVMPIVLGAAEDALGLSHSEAGLIATVEFLGFGAAPFVFGRWLEKAAAPACAALVLCHVLAAAVPGYTALLLIRAAAGLAGGTLISAANTAIARQPGAERYYARCVAAAVVVGSAGLALLGWPVREFGYAGAYGCAAVVALIVLPLVARWPRMEPQPASTGAFSRPLAFLLGVGFLMFVSDALVWPFAERIANEIGVDEGLVNALLGISLLAGLAGAVTAARLGTRYGTVRPLAVAMWLTALAGLGITLSSGAATFTVAAIIKNASIMLAIPFVLATAARLQSSAAALTSGAMAFGVATGPYLGGFLAQHWGFPASGATGIALVAMATLLLLKMRASLQPTVRSQDKNRGYVAVAIHRGHQDGGASAKPSGRGPA